MIRCWTCPRVLMTAVVIPSDPKKVENTVSTVRCTHCKAEYTIVISRKDV